MMWWSFLLILALSLPVDVVAPLPEGCSPLNDVPYSTEDVSDFFEENDELAEACPPSRIGSWREERSIPTQHFATNQIKPGSAPMRLMPYTASMTNEGITYDAYTMERWNDPERSDEMQQQTPSEVGAPWNKVTSVGTNMKQMVTGPDGNPKAEFSGRSGIEVGIPGSTDPLWESFGDMYANFMYTDVDGGTMEVPLVRGSPLLTHVFTDANPTLVPYCLSTVNGVPVSYSCPSERDVSDPGEGFIDATCSGGSMTIILRTTKPVELSTVQYAVNTLEDWDHAMVTCSTECTLSEDALRVDIDVPMAASGTMAYAVNVIGKFIIPQDWVDNPETVQCTMDREVKGDYRAYCDDDFCQTPSCDVTGSDVAFELVIELEEPLNQAQDIQIAADTKSGWESAVPPMMTCTDIPDNCEVAPDLVTITYWNTFDEEEINYAINVIGRYVKPPGDWAQDPYQYQCGDEPPVQTTLEPTTPGSTLPTVEPSDGPTVGPEFCQELPELSPCYGSFCKNPFCEGASSTEHYFKLVVQLDDPLDSIEQVEIAINTAEDWESSHPMVMCTPDLCTLESDGLTLTYCNTFPSGALKYALNIIGRFIQPPDNWETEPFQKQCGGSWVEVDIATRFVLELDEPNDALPDQTRKFVLYFSEEMRATFDADGLSFQPVNGGKFTGLMQMGYTGADARGDFSNASFLDPYAGVYSYSPDTSFCADDDTGYISFDWNKHDVNGPTESGDLLMITMPHHEVLLEDQGPLLDTPFEYKGFVGDSWLLAEELPVSSLEPDADAVERIKNDPDRLQDMLDSIEKDVDAYGLDWICDISNSYGVGKEIQMVARMATISRAFGTDDYVQLDESIRICLEKWLRITDTLDDGNKFRYDTVYGGLFLRSVGEDDPIDGNANYGFPFYSDHHFHLGMWVYTLGYYALYHTDWAQTHMSRILAVARDVGNPSLQDEYFPLIRHKDFYVGISWATGLVGGLRQAESSTEAINCYHGLAALGLALGDSAMEQVGRLMLATEVRSVREYYHLRAHNSYFFPPHLQDYGVIGQFAEDAIFYYTLNWPCEPQEFPMRHACLLGIQVIPITSASGLYTDQEWAGSVMDICTWANDPHSAPGSELIDPEILVPVDAGWGAFCHAVTAQYNSTTQQAAADFVRPLGTNQLVGGTSVSGTMLFIYEAT